MIRNTTDEDEQRPSSPGGQWPADWRFGEASALPAAQRHRHGAAIRRLLMAMAAIVALVGAGGTGGAIALHYDGHPSTATTATSPESAAAGSSQSSQLLASAAAKVGLSVVTITVTTADGTGEGSGVVLRSDGTIVTNNHVIAAAAGGAGSVTVTFATGQSVPAAIVGRNPAADIAVIRATGVSGAVPAQLGSDSALRAGDTVLAVGSPLGLSGTVTAGIVSALHRDITAGTGRSAETLSDVIQTDTAINPGNSGGALADENGLIIGITTAIATLGGGYLGQQSGSIGVGFAIPITVAYEVAAQLTNG